MPWSLEDIGEFALDLAKDITGVTNFQNASDAFKRANATANAVDGDVGKAITSLPSYVKDIGVGVGQAALGAGTALTNLIPATKAKKAADVITKTVTGGTKTAATKAEVISATASKNAEKTAKSADDAKAAAQEAAKEAAAAKKAAEAAAKKAAEAKTAEAAKKANEAKLKADKEAKEALAAKKAADEEAKAAAAAAKKAEEQKAAAEKALAAERAAAEKAAAAKAKEEADARAKADAEARARAEDAKAKADAEARAKTDAETKTRQDELDASSKAREDAAIKRREDAAAQAKAREEAAAAAKAKRDADSAARTKAREDAAQARKDELAAKKAERDAAAKAREEGRTKAEQEAAAAKARKDAEDAAIKAKAKKDAEDAAAAKKKEEEDAAAAAAKGEDVVVTPKVVTPKILDPDAVTTDGEDTDVVTPPPPTDTDGDGIPDNIDATPNGDGGAGPEELPPPGGGGGGGGGGNEGGDGGDPGVGGGGGAYGGGGDPFPIDGGGETVEGDGEDDDEGGDDTPKTTGFEKTWLILRAKLIAAGLPVKTVDRSVDYFRTVISEGSFSGDTEINDVVDQYLYIPEYTAKNGTKLKSPYYEDFGSFNDNLKVPKKPSELVPLVLGYEKLVDKYSVSEKFKNRDSIQKYLQNDTSVAELDERMNAARLRGLNADPNYLKTLQDLGYISSGTDLTDFFLDPAIGKLELESRRQTAAFATEAVRRSSAGITLDTASAQSNAARLTALGYSEAQVASLAGTGYENIAEQLNPTTALSGMYEKTGQNASALAPVIQKELEAEQFLGMASQRRKKLAEQNIRAFQGQSGISRYGLNTGSALGAI